MRTITAVFIILLAVSVVRAAPFEGLNDNNHHALLYIGSWSDVVLVDAFAGGYAQTTDSSASVSFEVYTSGLTVFFVFSPSGDDMSVCINADCTIVSTLGAESVGKVEITGLEAGIKQVVISKATANASVLNFDGFYVHPDMSGGAYVEYDLNGQTYGGTLESVITSGDILTNIMLAALLCMTVFSAISDWFNR